MNRGIIYFNVGRKCIPRLIVSINSLKKVYNGPLTLLTTDDQPEYKSISKMFNINVHKNRHMADDGANRVYLEKCLTHLNTPYDTTIWIDADTVVVKDMSEDLWDYAEKHEFAISRFSNWQSSGNKIRRRIQSWHKYYPDKIDDAVKFGPAINCGVIAFTKTSKLMNDWYGLAVKGRENFIPDESCCQLMLHSYPHIILDDKYNTSCKYSKTHDDTRIVHFHGRKHCRFINGKPQYMADIWIKYYLECLDTNICDIKSLDDHMPDRMIRRYKEYIKQ